MPSAIIVCGETMATKRLQWSDESLQLALAAINDEKLSLRQAASMYGILKSTLALYMSGKSQIGMKPGQSPFISAEEEKILVEYVLHMSRIGYGRTKEQLQDIVQEMMTKDGRPNPFKVHLRATKHLKPDLEEMMKPDTVALFNTRYEEGYDVGDEFYEIWSKLKTMSIYNWTNGSKDPHF